MDDALPRVVVTGAGVVNPLGLGLAAFWEGAAAGRPALRRISRFDAAGLPVQVAGELTDFRAADFVPRRFAVKSDRFTHYALAATELALADAALDLAGEARDRIGVWMGNDTGGWDLAERGFRELHRQGAAMVNPWAATAWFPAAPQGFMTIRHDLTGYSKSLVADRATGAAALYFGARAVRRGLVRLALAGGTEAPLTPLGVLAYHETGELSRATEPTGAYRPFDRGRDGLVLGEGSAVLVLETLDGARHRGARVRGELLGGALTFDADPGGSRAMQRAMSLAITGAGLAPSDVDLVLAEGAGTPAGDRLEAAAIAAVLPEAVHVSAPKAGYGHLFGASGVTEAACALMAIETGRLPPTPGLDDPEAALAFVRRPARASVRHVLVNARSREGVNVALLVGPPPAPEVMRCARRSGIS